jgi:phosphatidylglycerophosphate synthase
MLDSLMAQRPAVRSLQSHVAWVLYQSRIRANQATIIGGILGVTGGVLFARGNLALGILALALSGIPDAVDGTIAHEFAGATALG